MAKWLRAFAFEREAWLRFFGALGGLAVAFTAAVFSTVLRLEGHAWTAALVASVALVMAGVVAITTVPYLARRVAFERVRDVFDYDVTREGMAYLITTLVIGVAALNTGNNLLFIVVSAMLAAVLVSGVASAAVLRGVELEAVPPAHVFAGSSIVARLTVRNTRWLLPAFSVNVLPPKEKRRRRRMRYERTVFRWPPKAPPERQWLRIPDLALRWDDEPTSAPPIFTGGVYFPFIPADSCAMAEVELRFERRGRYAQEGFGLSTRFPFSFLEKTRRITLSSTDAARELIVYPSVEPTDASLEILPMITGEFESFVRGRGYNLYRIREYMPEDSARHVDWKATAKTGQLKVREFTREDERKLRIVFDNPSPDTIPEREYEAAVALAASLAWHFAGESTDLSFVAPGYSGSSDVYAFLRYLALVQPAPGEALLEKLQLTDDYNLIMTARPRGSIPTALWTCSYFVFMNGKK